MMTPMEISPVPTSNAAPAPTPNAAPAPAPTNAVPPPSAPAASGTNPLAQTGVPMTDVTNGQFIKSLSDDQKNELLSKLYQKNSELTSQISGYQEVQKKLEKQAEEDRNKLSSSIASAVQQIAKDLEEKSKASNGGQLPNDAQKYIDAIYQYGRSSVQSAPDNQSLQSTLNLFNGVLAHGNYYKAEAEAARNEYNRVLAGHQFGTIMKSLEGPQRFVTSPATTTAGGPSSRELPPGLQSPQWPYTAPASSQQQQQEKTPQDLALEKESQIWTSWANSCRNDVKDL